jgi:Family of unknown function (DUF6069)
MTYPASPSDAGSDRVRPDPARFWAGTAATAVVAALVALVGILICRWTLNIPILAPSGDGAWGSAHTAEYVLVAALAAIVAGALLYLLMLATPRPTLFFGWIVALITVVVVVYPFSTSAPLEQKAATAIVNLALGIAIISLLVTVAARAVRRPQPPRPPHDGGYRRGVPEQGYQPQQGYPRQQNYPNRPPGSQPTWPSQPTQPIASPPGREDPPR